MYKINEEMYLSHSYGANSEICQIQEPVKYLL